MKKRKKKTRDKNPCAGCEWGYELNEQQVYPDAETEMPVVQHPAGRRIVSGGIG